MDFMLPVTHFLLSLYLLFALMMEATALPVNDLEAFISTPVAFEFINYQPRPVLQKNSLLNRLTRGFYYIENGVITPVSPTYRKQNVPRGRRRQNVEDFDLDSSIEEYQTQYNKPHVKRKMLFVPNLFG